ncbi:hypothetical protein [Poseidonibacter lekithochrous]|uniref:hypothetical protein n=1 Tax=Poseidonibacter lekithochrous TaxID=1904463 RepID=UPI0008FC55A8|nr:hypothetical protein [Poseidonibacter lekithochrous]QKJ21894.1 hypothetical protein ALEK_0591 [Poseidonibacter lekithochrous]
MTTYPELLSNPSNPRFSLQESEIYSIKEVAELIKLEQYSYSLFAIWNTIVINIQRRIEFFGINNFLEKIHEEKNYNQNAHNLKERWLNVNEYKLITYAKELNLISNTCHDLITMIYWMKSNNNTKANENIEEEELYCVLILLDKNLFTKEFREDQRSNNETTNENVNNQNRREEDLETLNSVMTSKTHQELLLKESVKVFEKQQDEKQKEEKKQIIDKYI